MARVQVIVKEQRTYEYLYVLEIPDGALEDDDALTEAVEDGVAKSTPRRKEGYVSTDKVEVNYTSLRVLVDE